MSTARPLPMPPVSRRDARRAPDRVVGDRDPRPRVRPASGAAGARGGAWLERFGERQLRRAARAVVAGGLERGDERRIDEARR